MDDAAAALMPDIWEAAAEQAGTAIAGAAFAAAVLVQARKALNTLNPAATMAGSLRRQLPSTLERVAVHATHLQRTVAEQMEATLPVEDHRHRLAERGITTAIKLSLWNDICVYRLTSLVALPVVHAIVVNALALDGVVALIGQAEGFQATSKDGGMLMNVLMAQIMSQMGGLGADGAMGGRRTVALVSNLDSVFAAARDAVKAAMPADFQCHHKITAATVTQVVRTAFSAFSKSLDVARVLLNGAHDDASSPDEIAADEMFSDVARHASFRTLVNSCAADFLAARVLPHIAPAVQRCASYKAELGSAAAVQIVTELGPTVYNLSDVGLTLPPLTKRFCVALLAANVA